MNGNQYGQGQGGFQYPQQQQGAGFQQQFSQPQRMPFLKLQDGDNWIQLFGLQEREFTRQFPDNFGGTRDVTKTIRDIVVNGQQRAILLTTVANQQLQMCIQTVLSTGKNPLEFRFNIRKNRIGNMPLDVRYQVVTGEWVGLPTIQPNAYSQPIRTQAQQSPTPPMPFQQGQMQGLAYSQNTQQMPILPMGMGQISTIPQQVIQNPFAQGISPNAPIMPFGIPENVIVLSEQEKALLGMAEQGEKLEKVDFINKWVLAMRTQFNEPTYPIQRADIVFSQFYQK